MLGISPPLFPSYPCLQGKPVYYIHFAHCLSQPVAEGNIGGGQGGPRTSCCGAITRLVFRPAADGKTHLLARSRCLHSNTWSPLIRPLCENLSRQSSFHLPFFDSQYLSSAFSSSSRRVTSSSTPTCLARRQSDGGMSRKR